MEEKKKQINLIGKSATYKLIIPASVELKIRQACREVWDTEWSGVLFYTYEGKFEDGSLTIKCVDICFMDIGNAVYTEFNMSPEVSSYMVDNDLLDCQIGLIHSHNNMATFFSGTDLSTLRDEGESMNNFVSLIVNNDGHYTAAVTRKIKATNKKYDFFGEGEVSDENPITDIEIEYFKLNIINEALSSDITDRFNKIREEKRKEEAKKTSVSTVTFVPKDSKVKSIPTDRKEPLNIEFPSENDEYDVELDIPYGEITFNKDTIKDYTLQLVTGSIFMRDRNNLNLKSYAKTMESNYDSRFEDFTHFKDWAGAIVDCIVYGATDEHLSKLGYTEDEICAICAYDIKEELNTLPKNKYIDEFIKILEGYLI